METKEKYRKLGFRQFVVGINTEEKARELAWKMKFPEGFCCPRCGHKEYWELRTRPEIKQCNSCFYQVRLRTGTMFQNSKLPMLLWMQAFYFVMQDKRGISALSLMRMLGLTRYQTAWNMLIRIRNSLLARDGQYKLKGLVELDGAFYGHIKNENGLNTSVFIGVESKQWTDAKGKPKERAGFARIYVDPRGEETKAGAQTFSRIALDQNAKIKTDGRQMYPKLGHAHEYSANLKWVNRFISNSKTWILGTHHGLRAPHKYLKYYLAEYTYRFNRRHDPNSLFHRAFSAAISTKPITLHALCGDA